MYQSTRISLIIIVLTLFSLFLPFTGFVHQLSGDFVIEIVELVFCTESVLSPGETHKSRCITGRCSFSEDSVSSFSSMIGTVLLFFFNSEVTFHLLFIPSIGLDCRGLRRTPKGFLPSKCPFPINSLLPAYKM